MATETPAQARPILVPVDFSGHSLAALVWAADLAPRIGAPLVVLHVVHDPEEEPGYYRRPDADGTWTIERAAEAMLQEFIQRCEAERGSLSDFTTRLVVGVPVERILEVAEAIDARLIVMGSHGRTGLSRMLLGSKAQNVVQLAPMPVTIVKGPEPAVE